MWRSETRQKSPEVVAQARADLAVMLYLRCSYDEVLGLPDWFYRVVQDVMIENQEREERAQLHAEARRGLR